MQVATKIALFGFFGFFLSNFQFQSLLKTVRHDILNQGVKSVEFCEVTVSLRFVWGDKTPLNQAQPPANFRTITFLTLTLFLAFDFCEAKFLL